MSTKRMLYYAGAFVSAEAALGGIIWAMMEPPTPVQLIVFAHAFMLAGVVSPILFFRGRDA